MPRQDFARQAERTNVGRSAVGSGRRLQPAVTAELADQPAAGIIDVAMGDRQVFRAPFVEPSGQLAVTILEERPAEERAIGHRRDGLRSHQLPSKTGFCLATKAR